MMIGTAAGFSGRPVLTVNRPAGNGAAPRPAAATGETKANDEDWWTE